MDLQNALTGVRDVFTVKRVYGDPYERDGVTVIPAAIVIGGGGGGAGEDDEHGQGGGAGFGVFARPVGAYVVRDGTVKWEPAIARTWLIVAACGLAVAALKTIRVLRGAG